MAAVLQLCVSSLLQKPVQDRLDPGLHICYFLVSLCYSLQDTLLGPLHSNSKQNYIYYFTACEIMSTLRNKKVNLHSSACPTLLFFWAELFYLWSLHAAKALGLALHVESFRHLSHLQLVWEVDMWNPISSQPLRNNNMPLSTLHFCVSQSCLLCFYRTCNNSKVSSGCPQTGTPA